MADLEKTVMTMRSSSKDLGDRMVALEESNAALCGWIRDLESILVSNGQRDQVESVRRLWSSSATSPRLPEPVRSSVPPPRADPLATLATAASSFQRPHWEDDESAARKRRRQDDDYPSQQGRLPSPSRMRIDQLVTPGDSVRSPTSMSPDSWGWGHLPSIGAAHDYHQYGKSRSDAYTSKPRIAPPPLDSRALSPTERRPLSASSSSGTGRTWGSPVQSFDIRL